MNTHKLFDLKRTCFPLVTNACTRVASLLCVALVLVLSQACTTIKPAALRPTEPGSALRVQAINPGETTEVYGNEAVAGGVAAGAAGGALYGAGVGFVSGFSCGPLFIICSPAGAVVGTAAGAVVGGVVIGVEKGATSLPREKAEALNALLTRMYLESDFGEDMARAFTQNSDGRFQLVDASPQIDVALAVDELKFEQHGGDALTMHVAVTMQVRYGLRQDQQTKRYVFRAKSDKRVVDDWLADEGRLLHGETERLLAKTTAQMVQVLLTPPV